MMGGINNLALFKNNPRPALDKLNEMGGIMSSSAELMEAMSKKNKIDESGRVASMPDRNAFDALGNFIGSQTPPNRIDESNRVASMPDRNAFDSSGGITGLPTSLLGDYAFDYSRPRPTTLQPQDISQEPLGVISDSFSYQVKPMPKPVKGFVEGGLALGPGLAFGEYIGGLFNTQKAPPTQEQPKQESNAVGGASPDIDITDPAIIFLNALLQNDPNGIFSTQINKVYGSKKKAQATLQEKMGAIIRANTPEERATAITTSVGAPNTEEGLRDVASSVGIDVAGKDINTLVNEMTQVALNTSIADPGSMAARYGQALLFGYQNALAVQTARAGAGSGGGVKSSNYRNAKNAYQDAYTKALKVDENDLPEGMSKEQYAIQFAETLVNRTYTPDEIRAAGITMGSSPSTSSAAPITLSADNEEATKQFNDLPSGAKYIDNGVEYTKP